MGNVWVSYPSVVEIIRPLGVRERRDDTRDEVVAKYRRSA